MVCRGKNAFAFEKIVGNIQMCSLGKMRGIIALHSAYRPSNKLDIEVQFMCTIKESLPGEKAVNMCSMTSRKKKKR